MGRAGLEPAARGRGACGAAAGVKASTSPFSTCAAPAGPADVGRDRRRGRPRPWRPRRRRHRARPLAGRPTPLVLPLRRRRARRRARPWRLPRARSPWLPPSAVLPSALAEAEAPPSVICPSRPPGSTVSPSLAVISASTPAAGALTSRVTLSVSSSRIGSSRLDGVAGLLEPAPDGRLAHGFAQGRNAYVSRHSQLPPVAALQSRKG